MLRESRDSHGGDISYGVHLDKIIGFRVLLVDYFLTFMPADAIKMVLATIVGYRLIPVLRKPKKKSNKPES